MGQFLDDVSLSLSASSGAQSARDVGTGSFIVGGSGGANQIPTWVWIGALLLGAGLVIAFLTRK